MGVTNDLVIALALEQEGYLEKASKKDLDSHLANAGSNNFTKFGRDLASNVGSPFADGVAWCEMYVTWLFWKLGGKQAIQENLYGFSAYTPTSAQYFKNNNAWYTGKSPKPGYQIFFKNTKRICHTGLVLKCENGMVYTIEGNTSSAKGVVANGGCVRCKSYPVTYPSIAGYGIPKCASGGSNFNSAFNRSNAAKAKKALIKDVKDVQNYVNKNYMPALIKEGIFKDKLVVDGVYGKMTRHALLAVWKRVVNAEFDAKLDPSNSSYGSKCNQLALKCAVMNGDNGDFVTLVQLLLKVHGYYTGEIIDKFGDVMGKAVHDFEQAKGLIVESADQAKCGQQVWYRLFN